MRARHGRALPPVIGGRPGDRRYLQEGNGAGEYVRVNAHTNTVEGFFSLLKRGVNGVFHHIGAQYMDQHLAEFDFRYNHRVISDGARTIAGLKMAEGKCLMLRRPIGRT